MRLVAKVCKANVIAAEHDLARMLASPRMRAIRELRSPLAPALALTAGALFFSGGPGSDALPWLGAAAIALALALFATQSPPSGLLALAPIAALAFWCAGSIAWSIQPDRSWDYANRAFVYLAFALVGAFVGARPRQLMLGMSALLGAVCVWSLAGKVLPWLYADYGRVARLRGPVGYWNSLALLGDIALPIGLCLATRARASGTLLIYGWLVAIGLTYSRGGVAVAVVVIALWIGLSRAWLEAASTLLAAGLPAAGALIVAFSLSGVTSDVQSHTTRVRDGLVFGAILLLDAAIAVALARFSLPRVPGMRRAALVLVTLGVAAAIVVGALHARSWWDGFTSPVTTELPNSPNRLVQAGANHRWVWWTEAWEGWKTKPLEGTGAGSFDFTNLRYRKTYLDRAIEPHNLPVQFLSETGIVGVVLFGASVAWLVAVGRRRPGPQLALALALPAYFLHSLLDIDWDFAAVTAPVFLIAGALATAPSGRRRPSAFAVLTAGGLGLAVVFSLFAVWFGNRWTGQAEQAIGTDNTKVITLAGRARSMNPLTVEPLLAAADAEISNASMTRKRKAKTAAYGRALGYLRRATALQPDNAEAWYSLGAFDLHDRKCPRAALPALSRFTVLNGQDPKNVEYAAALKLVNSGKPIC
jgi:hypothetical protein